jgi:hypothetical protein
VPEIARNRATRGLDPLHDANPPQLCSPARLYRDARYRRAFVNHPSIDGTQGVRSSNPSELPPVSCPTRSRSGAGVVVQPDALAEQDRGDVEVDLVDQSQLQKLTADGGREHLEVLAAGRRRPDPHRLGRATVQERDPVGGRPGSGPNRFDPPARRPWSGRTPRSGPDGTRSGHPAHLVVRPGHEAVQ